MKLKSKYQLNLIGMISSIIVVLSSLLAIIINYIITYKYQFTTYEEVLESFSVNAIIHTSESIVNIVMALAIIPVTIAIFLYLMEEINLKRKKLLIIPLITSILGALIAISLYILKFYLIFELAPKYMTSIDQEAILETFAYLILISNILSATAFILLNSIGTVFFSIFTLRDSTINMTYSWTGILSGVLTLGKLGLFLQEGFAGAALQLAASIGAIIYFIWIGTYFFTLQEYKKRMDLGFTEIESL